MTHYGAAGTILGLLLVSSLSACGSSNISEKCHEPQAYQSVVAGERITVPEGLDSLDDFKEMPIPKAETAPRPEGAPCIESPPAILSGSSEG